MTCGIILIQMIEKRYTVDILVHKKILPNLDNKLIKANFKDLVTFRININFIQMFEINMYSRTSMARTRQDRRCEFDPSMCSSDT